MEGNFVSRIIEPAGSISVLVRKFIALDLAVYPENRPGDKHIPDGSCNLVFNFCGKIKMSTEDAAERFLPPYFLTLPYLGYVNVVPQCEMSSLIVVCKSSVLTGLTGISLTGGREVPYISAEEIIPEKLWHEMRNCNTPEGQIGLFSEYIRTTYHIENYVPDEIDRVYETIFESGGCMKISALTGISGMSDRTFRNQFRKRVGISAKGLSRLVRVHLLWRHIYESGNQDLMDLTYRGNFFDQSHLDHDIKKILGECPGKFFKRDLELVRIYSGF